MTTITVQAGKTHSITLVYKTGDGNIVDITDSTARLVVRKSLYAAPLIDVAAVIVGASGAMVFTINPADTASILTTKCEETLMCGVELTLVSGAVIPFLEGSDFILLQSVVR